jgi:outer membrane protein assembly factor BamB
MGWGLIVVVVGVSLFPAGLLPAASAASSPRLGAGLTPASREAPAPGTGTPTLSFTTSPSFPASANWLTYEHDVERSGDSTNETVLSPQDAQELEPVASVDLPLNSSVPGSQSSVTGSVAVAGGYVYVGSWNGALYELDATNLSIVWSLQLTNPRLPGAATNTSRCWRLGGIGSTPTVIVQDAGSTTYNTVVVAAGTGLYAINASLGPGQTRPTIDWFTNLTNYSFVPAGAKNWGYADLWGTPLVYDGYAYMGVASACDQRFVQGQLFQVALQGSGRYHVPAHVFNVTGYTGSTGDVAGGIWSAPMVDPSTNTLWVTTGNENGTWSGCASQPYVRSILGLNASNISELRSVFQVPQGSCYDPSGIGPDEDFGAGPTLFHDPQGAALAGAANKDGTFWVVNATTGQAAWNCSIGDSLFSPLAPAAWNGSTLFVAGDGQGGSSSGEIFAITPEPSSCAGISSLTPTSGGVALGGLTYANGLLVVAYNDGSGAGPGVLAVYSAASGQELSATTESSSINGEPIVADGRVYFGVGNAYTADEGSVVALGIPMNVSGTAAPLNGSPGAFQFEGGVAGGMPGYAYTWSFGDGQPNASVADPVHQYAKTGNYTIDFGVRDDSGEVESETFRIVATAAASGEVSRAVLDEGVELWINLTPPVSGPVNVTWTGLPFGCPTESAVSLTCRPYSLGTFSPLASWSSGPAASGSVELPSFTVHPPLVARARLSPPAVGVDGEVSYSANVSGGTPPYVLAWALGGAGSSNRTNGTFFASVIGDEFANLTVTDGGGGQSTASARVFVATYLTAALPFLPDVDVGALLVLNLSEAGGLPPYSVTWTGLPTGCKGGNSPQIEWANTTSFACTPQVPGVYEVTAELTDDLNQSAAATGSVTVAERLEATAGPTRLLSPACASISTRQLSVVASGGTPPYGYSWTGPGLIGATNESSAVIDTSGPGPFLYQISVSDSGGGRFPLSLLANATGLNGCGGVPTASPWTAIAFGLAIGLGGVLILAGVLWWARRSKGRRGPS